MDEMQQAAKALELLAKAAEQEAKDAAEAERFQAQRLYHQAAAARAKLLVAVYKGASAVMYRLAGVFLVVSTVVGGAFLVGFGAHWGWAVVAP